MALLSVRALLSRGGRGSGHHADLFLENPVKLPFLGVDLPLLAFFFLAPILFVIVHAYTLVHLVFLTDKATRFHHVLTAQIGDPAGLPENELIRRASIRAGLRRQLPSNIFVQFLAGPLDIRDSPFGRLLRAIAWLTLVIAAILLLLLMQIQFLPFHSSFITWTQRIVLILDLGLLSWLWPKILSARKRSTARRIAAWVWPGLSIALGACALLFSWVAATFTGEWQEEHLATWRIFPTSDEQGNPTQVSLHDWVFNSPVDDVSRRRRFPLSSTLVLSGFNIYEGLGLDEPKKADWRDFVFRARGRDLKGARFDFAVLRRVDFKGAELEGAKLYCAQLQGASLDDAQLRGALLDCAQLQGASLVRAQLQSASLVGARLQGATLDKANLQRAVLIDADLQGASLQTSLSQLARFDRAQLQGASLRAAWLQPASLENAQLQGASLEDAHLKNASLLGAQLQGASLSGAQLQGASLGGAQLEGALLTAAQVDDDSFKPGNVDDAAHAKALAAELKALVCFNGDDPIYVLRGLLSNDQIAATGSEAPALIDFIISKDCSVFTALTDADRAKLLRIKQQIEKAGK